jgi:thiol-disulfide isomerase/thioredoxin
MAQLPYSPLRRWLLQSPLGLVALPAQSAPTRLPQDFVLQTSKGEVVLSQIKASVLYLDIWASWCGPCKLSFPWMQTMHERYASQGLSIIAVNVDERPSDAQQFLKRIAQPGFTLAFDHAALVPQALELKVMPTAYVIRPASLELLHRHAGFRLSDQEPLERLLTSLLDRSKKPLS